MDREIGEVQQRDERLRRERLVVGRDQVASRLEERLGPFGLDIPAGLDQVEVGRGRQQVGRGLVGDCGADHRVGLGPERQPMLRFGGPSLALGVVGRPLVERDDALPGRLHELLAELDRLGQDDLLLGGQEDDPADLVEVHADRVFDPDHVRGERLELLGGRLRKRLGVEPGLL